MFEWHYWVIVGLLAANVWITAFSNSTLNQALHKLRLWRSSETDAAPAGTSTTSVSIAAEPGLSTGDVARWR